VATKGISLHIGVNTVNPEHYGGWSGPLAACEMDAQDMTDVAGNQGYQATTLLTADATRETVTGLITRAARDLSAGDIFLLTYAGHGGQVPDKNGDEQDLTDETWCLYDGQLVDDELYALWASFEKDVRVFVLSDSCHSGSVTRAPLNMADARLTISDPLAELLGTREPVHRHMPDDMAARTYRKNKAFYDHIQQALPGEPPEIRSTVRLISGCQDNQVSLDGKFNGLFTGQLLRVWSSGGFNGSYADFHKAIVRRMPSTQTPNHFVVGTVNPAFDGQKPFQI
jgi:hypothetical protein